MPYALVKGGRGKDVEDIVEIEIKGNFERFTSHFQMTDSEAAAALLALFPAQSLAIQGDEQGDVFDVKSGLVKPELFLMIAPVSPTMQIKVLSELLT